MLLIPSKVSAHVRFLLFGFNDSDYHSLAQEICQVLSSLLPLKLRYGTLEMVLRKWFPILSPL